MDVSFIIINYNTRHYLERCLASIEQFVTGVSYEIIVVDNASKDDSINFIQNNHPSIELICNDKNQGFAKANNQAAKIASGDFLFLLNADTVMHNNGLGKALECMKANNISVLGPKLLNKDGSLQVSFHKKNTLNKHIVDIFSLAFPIKGLWRRIRNKSLQAPTSPASMGFLVGAALIIDSQIVQQFGLFDEDYFFIGEERDFCLKMLRQNKKIIYFPDFQIIHYGGSGDPHSSFHLVNWYKASCTLARKHGTSLQLILIKIALSCFYINRTNILYVKNIFTKDNSNKSLPQKYLYIFLWSVGYHDEKKLI